ncbi:hypothetical protein NDU88_004043 [Pleurodeles waltl]|uniref:Uncharacterized protein n=1 Tax=Pleurodeles waltl TaxID=8319 RepID=A0AAV7V1R9_PLEWA|nr:hypothetical protein NDU88_004043 [Pleurodeles waltl]
MCVLALPGMPGLAPSRSRSRSLGSFRPGSKVNQARPGTQDIHLPQGVAFHRSTRSPDVAAVQLARFTSLPPPGHPSAFQPGPGPQHAIIFKFSPAGGSRGPGPPPRPQPGTASRPGGQGGLPVPRVTLAPPAPARRRSPRVLLYDRRGGAAGAPAAGIHPRGAPQPSPGLSPPNLNSPQQEDPGGQGLRHGPSPAPQAAQAVREGSRSSGSHSHFTRRCGTAHPAPSSTTGGGGAAGAPRGRDPPAGRAPALTRPLAAPRPAADDFVGAPKPTSDPPGTTRSGCHLELLFTGAAGSSYEGEPPAFHQFVPPDFSTGPRDTGAPCIALSAPLDHGN